VINRRDFLRSSIAAGALASVARGKPEGLTHDPSSVAAWVAQSPIKLAHREGNMLRTSSPGVYELAAKIPGISGIEVQTTRSNLWDRDTVLAYKRESLRWNIRTVSMGGSLPNGGTLLDAGPCEQSLRKTIRAGEILGAGVVLVPGFRETCPKMDDEASYGPVVKLLQKLAPVAEEAGIVLGLELSLTTDEYVKLLGLVAHAAVRAYWDATGTESMVHNGEGLKGIEVLGAKIVQMHLKNNRDPLMENPGLVDWSKAWPAIRKSGFEGWYAFETPHASPEACIEETKKNVAWVMRNRS
jgi:sugar phosphate isomerase/epimerase